MRPLFTVSSQPQEEPLRAPSGTMSRLEIEDRFHVVVLKWSKLIHHLTLGHSFMGFDHHDLEDAILRDCVRDVSGQTRQRDIYRVVFAGYTADETVNDAELLGGEHSGLG